MQHIPAVTVLNDSPLLFILFDIITSALLVKRFSTEVFNDWSLLSTTTVLKSCSHLSYIPTHDGKDGS
ncbi:predicted protein [Lichtheimia corymbifera JMRC:FSU:9682]|uniref:Uncharacterized protein n=1 Tax=Lichtheimia corymbifera JMRC:FSU:9682 TaxID=1263082 RepID=A0A068SBM2_9FUNG|nr:predicted protein [Lichtheimia corymbifera JMRC:FSU:9682]